jgi:acetate kinase
VIEECQVEHPDLPQYLTFDTAFHASLPEKSYRYLLPEEIIDQFGFRKYGFHGLSYQYVTRRASEFLQRDPAELKIIACHLGTGGSSAAAILHGKSIDTTMGFTPLAGLMMSTRTGDLDPWLVLRLMEDLHLTPESLDALLNKKSGLLGISGFSSDLRDILGAMDASGKQDERARLAFDMYVTQLRKTIGSLAAELGGVDVLIFTDDIGAQNDRVRHAACQGLEWCGISLDESLNQKADPKQINLINTNTSPAKIVSMPTDEELVIAEEGWALVEGRTE